MITLKLSFYSLLIKEFGQEIYLDVDPPINFFELFNLFSSISGQLASSILLEKNYTLKENYIILLNGQNIDGFKGLKTIIEDASEVDFFHKVGGG